MFRVIYVLLEVAALAAAVIGLAVLTYKVVTAILHDVFGW